MASVVVVGGGPAGLTCAIVLASSVGQAGMPSDLEILVLDDGRSDLLNAELHNVPGFPRGTPGVQVLAGMRSQLASFPACEIMTDTVLSVDPQGEGWEVSCASGQRIPTEFVVVACGYKEIRLEVPNAKLIHHGNSPKPRLQFEVAPHGRLAPGLYAAGTVAGMHPMFAAAAGHGTTVACHILGDIMGKPMHVHDIPGSRKT